MRRLAAVAGVALLLLACARAPQGPAAPGAVSAASAATGLDTDADTATDATFVLPGAFAPDRDLAWLQRRFGHDNVHVGEVPGAEGALFRGVVLFPDDPARRAYLYFQDAARLHGLSLVRVLDRPSRWRLDNGVGPGMPLAELVARNGAPLRFTGFDWDYGGAISDWNGGRLGPRADDPVRRIIALGHGDAASGDYPLGDSEFASDDPRYPRLGSVVVVDGISVSFPGEDDL